MTRYPGSRYLPGFLCFVYGGAMVLAFAPYGYYPVAIIAPALFLHLLMDGGHGQAFRYGYLFGLGMFASGVNWLHISINLFGGMNLAGSLLITFLLVAFLALYPALTVYSWRRWFANTPGLVLALPALWVIGEWLRSWILTGFPWLHLGYSQIDSPLGGLAPAAGIYGVSLATIATAAWLLLLSRVTAVKKLLALAAITLLWSAGWVCGERPWTVMSGAEISVALIQGAVPQEIKWLRQYRQQSFDLYKNLSDPYWDHDLIVWPETAVPAFNFEAGDFLQPLQERAAAGKTMLLTGIPVGDELSDRYFNGAMLFGDGVSTYYKRHLVPFGEYLPFDSLLRPLLVFLEIPMSNFSPGDQVQPLLSGRNLALGISICYEDTFGEQVIEALPTANLLVNLSNDAWFGDSIAPHQHLQMARMRSRETGRYMLRATNTGITAIFDETGKIIRRVEQFKPAVAAASVRLFTGATPYVRFGNLPVLIICLLLLAVTRRRGYTTNPASG